MRSAVQMSDKTGQREWFSERVKRAKGARRALSREHAARTQAGQAGTSVSRRPGARHAGSVSSRKSNWT